MSSEDRAEFLRVRNHVGSIFRQLGEIKLAIQQSAHDAAGAARHAAKLERKLLNGGSGEIQRLSDRIEGLKADMQGRDDAIYQRMRGFERLAWIAVGASGVLPIVLALVGMAVKFGWLSSPFVE